MKAKDTLITKEQIKARGAEMTWKDTVLTDNQIEKNISPNTIVHYPTYRSIAESQAEATWKVAFEAGYQLGKRIFQNTGNESIEQARQEGRKEVVKWFEDHKLFALVPIPKEYVIYASDWQEQKKVWGIE